jgi:hypothetical protein
LRAGVSVNDGVGVDADWVWYRGGSHGHDTVLDAGAWWVKYGRDWLKSGGAHASEQSEQSPHGDFTGWPVLEVAPTHDGDTEILISDWLNQAAFTCL